jgi:hypothetical protein
MVAMKSAPRRFMLVALLLALVGCSQPPSNAFRVGMELAYPPFETNERT